MRSAACRRSSASIGWSTPPTGWRESQYLYQGQPTTERAPIEPFASFATGANEMSPLDMASGIQTLANEGVHFKPYFVDYVDDADGQRIYTHLDPGTQVLDAGAALPDRRHPEGRAHPGHGRDNYPLAGGRPAFGKTGTQDSNTNAWFSGGTPPTVDRGLGGRPRRLHAR